MVRQLVSKKRQTASGSVSKPHSTIQRFSAATLSNRSLIIGALLVCILMLSFFLNTAALHWGQTGDVSWSPDSIEGRITAIYLPYLSKMWTHKYPRGQYIVSSVFYKPKIEQWQKDPVAVQLPNGQTARSALNQPRLYELASITRWISVVMSTAILVAVFLSARKLFDDSLAGLLSAFCLALSCLFLFYSRTGCVDIPAFFWFAWAGCFGLYAVKSDNLLFYVSAAFCAAWAVCTKEGVATFFIGLAVGLAVLLVRQKMSEGQPLRKAITSLFGWKVLVAVAVAVLVFTAMEGMWSGLDEWHYRSKFWKGVVDDEFKSQNRSVLDLLVSTYKCLFSGWGGPFLVLLGVSVIYWLIRYRWQLVFAVFPLLSFFILTVLVVEQNLPRFMLCGYAGMAILLGKTLADWYRAKRIPAAIRGVLPMFVFVPTLICCFYFNLEMKHDTRIRAERWMQSNATVPASIGLSMSTKYAPRVWLDGFRSIPQWDSKGVKTKNGTVQIRPDYIIGSNQWPCQSHSDQAFFSEMFQGKTEYQQVATFEKMYFNPRTRIWKYCLRFFELHGNVSPRIMIYKKP